MTATANPIEAWLHQAQQKSNQPGRTRPWVTLCYAQSLDGSLTARRGAPLALSGPESMTLTHRLRAAHDAILVGLGTIQADDPSLTVRLASGRSPQPVVLDSQLNFPLHARLLQPPQRAPWIATLAGTDPTRAAALLETGARLLEVTPGADGRVSLPALLACLAEMGIRTVMVEGGARVISSFLQQELADAVVLTLAPVYVGGLRAPETRLERPPRLQQPESLQLGPDLIVWGELEYPPPAPGQNE